MKIDDRKMNARHIYYMISNSPPLFNIYDFNSHTHTHTHTTYQNVRAFREEKV